MGIIKQIEKPNGVVFGYHRVNTILIHTNNQNIIEVTSYISPEKRRDEVKRFVKSMHFNVDDDVRTFTETTYYPYPYDPTMTVDSAYDYLLTLPEYEGAEMEDTEFMLDAEAIIPEIQEELAENQPTPEESSEEGE